MPKGFVKVISSEDFCFYDSTEKPHHLHIFPTNLVETKTAKYSSSKILKKKTYKDKKG